MGDFINKGNAGFQSVRKGTYVDKSGLISYMNSTLGTLEGLICVCRPRRFGKTFAAKMLSAYYDKSCDSRHLFEDLEIAKDPSFEEHLNKYDVIYLDITWFISIAKDIKDVVTEIEEKLIEELCTMYPEIKKSHTLSLVLLDACRISGGKFIFIIDEWDALFREAPDETELQKDYIRLLYSLFKSPFTAETIEAVYMTGILPIKKYATESGLNNFYEYTMLHSGRLKQYWGFTEEEVRALCEQSGLEFADMQHWYDGYVMRGNVHVYNPKAVMEALFRKKIGNYWTQTETLESLKKYIDMDFDGLQEAIVQLLGGAHYRIDEYTFLNDMTNIHFADDVLTLLVHLGYLSYNSDEKAVRIPNEEIRQEFIRAVKKR